MRYQLHLAFYYFTLRVGLATVVTVYCFSCASSCVLDSEISWSFINMILVVRPTNPGAQSCAQLLYFVGTKCILESSAAYVLFRTLVSSGPSSAAFGGRYAIATGRPRMGLWLPLVTTPMVLPPAFTSAPFRAGAPEHKSPTRLRVADLDLNWAMIFSWPGKPPSWRRRFWIIPM